MGASLSAEDGAARSALLLDAARRTTALVGDGCIVRIEEDGQLIAVAADHVEEQGRTELERLIGAEPVAAEGSWLGQALERRQSLRLPDITAAGLQDAGLPPEHQVSDVMVVPLPTLRAVVVATRDRWSEPYMGANRREIEKLAVDLELKLRGAGVRPEPRDVPPAQASNGFNTAERSLLDAISAAVWVVDDSGATVYVNETASELVGRPAVELVNQPISDYLGRISQPRRGAFQGTEVIQRPLVGADGNVTWMLSTSCPLRPEPGGRELVLYTLFPCDELHDREVRLRLRLARQDALLELAEAAGTDMQLEELLSDAVRLICEQLDVEMAGIGAFDLEALHGQAVASQGWPPPIPDAETGGVRPIPMVERSATVAALRHGEPVLVWDYDTQGIYDRDPILEVLGVKSAAIVPFAGGSAAVAAHSTRAGAIDGDGLALVETVARLIQPRWQVAWIRELDAVAARHAAT